MAMITASAESLATTTGRPWSLSLKGGFMYYRTQIALCPISFQRAEAMISVVEVMIVVLAHSRDTPVSPTGTERIQSCAR